MLENIALIENLEDSKKVSGEIAEKMVEAAATEKGGDHGGAVFRRGGAAAVHCSTFGRGHAAAAYAF